MRHTVLLVPFLALLAACQSPGLPRVVDADPAQREALFAAVSGLEGRWQGTEAHDGGISEFKLSSAGSAVREVMFPGAAEEMTNMYTLDGNSLLMTHYCAAGNQPHMRATSIEDGRISFHSVDVSDLKSADDVYMGEMTLVIVDADHIEQHWRALKAGEFEHEMKFEMARVP